MELTDSLKQRIDNYFETISEEEFIEDLKSSGFIVIDDEDDCSNKSLVEQLEAYLDNATTEQLEEDYNKLRKWLEIGPTIEEYFGTECKLVEIDGKLYLELS